jgi:uncharacterized protein (DUF983 family)
MPYRRFFREAEPYKILPCGSCGAQLRRSWKTYLLLAVMLLLLVAIAMPLLIVLLEARMSFWVILAVTVVLMALWTVLTNYLGWRLVGWVAVEEKKEP